MPDTDSVYAVMTNAVADDGVYGDGGVVVKGRPIFVLVVPVSKLAHREQVA